MTLLCPIGHLGLPLSLGNPGLQIPESLEVMSASSPPASVYMWSFHTTFACKSFFTGLPPVYPPEVPRAWLTSQKMVRRPGLLPSSCHLCLPPFPLLPLPSTWFPPGSPKFFLLRYKERLGSCQLFYRRSPNSGIQQNQGHLFIKNLLCVTMSNLCFLLHLISGTQTSARMGPVLLCLLVLPKACKKDSALVLASTCCWSCFHRRGAICPHLQPQRLSLPNAPKGSPNMGSVTLRFFFLLP